MTYAGRHDPFWPTVVDENDVEVEVELDVELELDAELDVADADIVLDTPWVWAAPPPLALVACVVVPVAKLDELLPDEFNVPANVG